MVLQPEVRSPSPVPHARHPAHDARRPDPVRIAGIAGALLLNSAVLLVMLVPLGRPGEGPAPPRGIEAEWFEPRPVPPDPPPEIVPVQRPVPPAPSAPAQRVAPAAPAPVAPPRVDGGSLAADPLPPPGSGDADIAPAPPATGPVTGVHLAYASASAPPYPRGELLAGHRAR